MVVDLYTELRVRPEKKLWVWERVVTLKVVWWVVWQMPTKERDRERGGGERERWEEGERETERGREHVVTTVPWRSVRAWTGTES